MAALAADAGDVDRDVLSYRAERLLMHARVLATIPAGRRSLIDDRRKREPATRVFSVGIGGVDLGMNVALARAARRGGRLGLSANEPQAAAKEAAQSSAGTPPGAPPSDPPGLVAIEWPDHGLGPVAERAVVTIPGSTGTIVSRRRPGSVVRQGSFKAEGAQPAPWVEVVSAMDGPEARSRRCITDPAGGAASFERLEDGRFLAYQFVRAGDTLRATPSVPTLPGEAYAVARAAAVAGAVPGDLLLMDLPEAQGGSVADGRGEAPAISVRLRAPGGSERVASVPRSLLQRLVRGREIDLTPERPLQAFTPAAEILGSSRELMVLELPDQTRAPWAGPIAVRPGEEDPARLAAALTRWWSADPAPTARAVVGVDAVDSPVRWAQAPLLDGTLSLVAPESGFPAETNAVRAELAGLPGATTGGRVLLVVSDEAPGVLGRRLRALASDPGSSGKVLAVVSLGGTVRADLPASLLGERKIAALGLYQPGGVGVRKSLAAVAAWAKDAVSEGYKGKRVEDPPGPFNWFY
jgi:hypothetical protein